MGSSVGSRHSSKASYSRLSMGIPDDAAVSLTVATAHSAPIDATKWRRPAFRPLIALALLLVVAGVGVTSMLANSTKRWFGNFPAVQLDVGTILGLTQQYGVVEVDAFFGVPFAEPPILDYRFEKTVPIGRWRDPIYTQNVRSACPPIWMDSPYYSEDCLYLNLFVPKAPLKSNGSRPIVFVIHGGAYETGSAGVFGMDNPRSFELLKKGVVIVSIQYRLGVFGFASDGTKDFAGNLGYWDQLEALHFIHRNAQAFGADPRQITVLGCSAGGASVSALTIAPRSRALIHQAVAMSGSVFAAWTTNDAVVKNTLSLIEAMGKKEGESVKERLKRANLFEMYAAILKTGTVHFGSNFVTFGPRLDGDFFPHDYPELIASAAPKAMVTGTTTEEALIWTLISNINGTVNALAIPDYLIPTFNEVEIQNLVRNTLITETNFGNRTADAQQRFLDFYLSAPNGTRKDYVFYLQRYTQIFSDLQFNIPTVWDILLRQRSGWKMYAYKATYVNPLKFTPRCPIHNSSHASDQAYGGSPDDIIMEQQTVDWLTAFVLTGDPSTPSLQWTPTSSIDPLRYIDLRPKPSHEHGFWEDRAQFYAQMHNDFDYDLVREMKIRRRMDVSLETNRTPPKRRHPFEVNFNEILS